MLCSIFSGKAAKEHGHTDFREAARKKIGDIGVDFLWDILHAKGLDVRAMQINIH